jgi:hypothetical protein
MLKRLADLQRAHTWIFVGYSFQDGIITDLLAELEEAIGRDFVRWSYAVMRNVSEYDRDFLEQYKVKAIACSAQYFFNQLADRSNEFDVPTFGSLSHDAASAQLERSLLVELDNQFEWVKDRTNVSGSPSSFYRGNQPSWDELAAHLDFPRDQADFLEAAARKLLAGSNDPLESPTKRLRQ